MSLTRRSFIKKSSFSAAAVTVLGTGVGLAQVTSSTPWVLIREEIHMPAQVDNLAGPGVEWENTEAGRNAARAAGLAHLKTFVAPNQRRNFDWGSPEGKDPVFLIQATPNHLDPVSVVDADTGGPITGSTDFVKWRVELPAGWWTFIYWL